MYFIPWISKLTVDFAFLFYFMLFIFIFAHVFILLTFAQMDSCITSCLIL